MSGTPALSVLLPVRNGAGTIRTAVRSTLRALPREAELLVFDDASTDATPEVLRAVRDPRLRVLHADAPTGVAGGLNRLLAEARGEFVARMDADDVTLPGRFVRQLGVVRGDVDVVFGGHLRFGRTARAFRQKRQWHLSSDTVRVWLALENPLTHPTMLGRAALIRKHGYRPGPAEDYDLWLRLAADGARIERLLQPVIGYRMHEAQVTMGERYVASVREDPGTREAHDRHAAALGWTGGSVWRMLVVAPESRADLELKREYWGFLAERAESLRPFERHLLRAAMRREFRGAEDPAWS